MSDPHLPVDEWGDTLRECTKHPGCQYTVDSECEKCMESELSKIDFIKIEDCCCGHNEGHPWKCHCVFCCICGKYLREDPHGDDEFDVCPECYEGEIGR
jgi:hypothetical protein